MSLVQELVLAKELEFYKSNKTELLEKYRGKYVIIKGRKVIDWFSSYKDAYEGAIDILGNVPFFIKKVVEIEPVVIARQISF